MQSGTRIRARHEPLRVERCTSIRQFDCLGELEALPQDSSQTYSRRSGAAQAAERHDGCVRGEGGQKVGCNWNRNAGDENNKRQKKICCTMMERMDKRDQELRKDEEEPELVE